MVEDPPLELAELRADLQPQLVEERTPGVRVGGECVGLPAGLVEGDHELPPGPLAERMLGDELPELADDVRSATLRELGVDPTLGRRCAQLLEPGGFRPCELVVGELLQRRPSVEREGTDERFRSMCVLATLEQAGTDANEPGGTLAVELAFVDDEPVPPADGQDAVAAERLPQAGDLDLERLRGVLGQLVAPDLFDQPVGGDRLVRMDEQGRQQPTRPAAGGRKRPAVLLDLQGSQDPELHSAGDANTVETRSKAAGRRHETVLKPPLVTLAGSVRGA